MKRILIPVDGSENALRAVRHVVQQSFSERDLEVHVVHASVPMSSYVARFVAPKERARYREEKAEAAVAPARELLSRHSVPHVVHIRFGDPVATIVAASRLLRVSQIVMGTARKNLLIRFLQDSVSARITDLVSVPVQLVTGKHVPRWERIGVPAVVSAAFAALLLAAVD